MLHNLLALYWSRVSYVWKVVDPGAKIEKRRPYDEYVPYKLL